MKDVIVFAGALYDSPLWTNRQHVSTRLAALGWRVIYVEPRLFLPRMMLGKFIGTRGRFSWFSRIFLPWKPQNNLFVVSQVNLLPGSREKKWISNINHFINRCIVKTHAYLRGFQDPAILIYDTEAAQFLDDFPGSRVIYDCVDDHKVQAGVNRNSQRVEEEEIKIAERAAAISVTTEPLFERFKTVNANVVLNSNATDIERFAVFNGSEPSDLASIPRPRVGTVGALDDYKIDSEILAVAAQKHPEWNFVLVGPVNFAGLSDQDSGIKGLTKYKNIHFLGHKKYEDVPAYVHGFDVAIIPYKKSTYNDSSFPLKFWEFVASGKMVVATNLPALASFHGMVQIASSKEDFISEIEDALLGQKKALGNNYLEEARKHDWSQRVRILEGLLL